ITSEAIPIFQHRAAFTLAFLPRTAYPRPRTSPLPNEWISEGSGGGVERASIRDAAHRASPRVQALGQRCASGKEVRIDVARRSMSQILEIASTAIRGLWLFSVAFVGFASRSARI